MDKTNPTEYADAFYGEPMTDSGYGIDPGQADRAAMADAFESDAQSAPVHVAQIEATVLPPLEAEAPVEPMSAPEPAAAPEATPEATPEFKTFGQAFKYHRAQALNGGPKTFEWKGKKFTTQLKSEAANKPAAADAKTQPLKPTQPVSEARTFEDEFASRDKPKIDRTKTLAYREGAASQPVNLNADPTQIQTAEDIAAGVSRAAANRDADKPLTTPAPAKSKDDRPWYEFGPKNTLIREGDNPKQPIYGSKAKGSESPAKAAPADDLYRGQGTN